MATPTKQEVLDALTGVIDPGKGRDVVALGMISGVVIRDGNVGFAIEVAPDEGEAKEPVRLACETAVEALPGVLSVTAVLTAERATSGAGEQGPAGAQDTAGGGDGAQQQAGIPGVRAIVAVASGKGGVGKSTTAVNLAVAMAQQGARIGLLDCDIYGPSIPRMLRIHARPESPDGKVLLPLENYDVKCMSIGFLVEEDTPMIWRGPMVMGALEQMMRDVRWGELDLLVCDLPPGTGDAQLTMAQRVPLSGAVIVSTPQDIALVDVRKGINMFRQVNVPVFGIVENMSYFLCPKCGERSHIFHHGGAREMAERLGTEFLGEIPLDIEIRMTSDSGQPIVVAQPDSAHAKAYHRIAARVVEHVGAASADQARQAPRIVMS